MYSKEETKAEFVSRLAKALRIPLALAIARFTGPEVSVIVADQLADPIVNWGVDGFLAIMGALAAWIELQRSKPAAQPTENPGADRP